MNIAAVALLGAVMGQPPVALAAPAAPNLQDYQFYNDRQIRLPINYNSARTTIRAVALFVSRDAGNTWNQEGMVTPDRDSFLFTAKDDGVYWFTVVTEDIKGHKDIADVTKVPPDRKMIVKTTKPRIAVTNFSRTADTIIIQWQVQDKYPNENLTKVHFRPASAPDNAWKEVSLPEASKSGVQFSSGTLEPIVVRITAYDLAKNKGEAFQQYEAGVKAMSMSAGASATASPALTGPLTPVAPTAPPLVTPAGSVGTGPATVTPAAPVATPTPTLPISPPYPPAHTGPSADPLAPVAPPPPSVPAAPYGTVGHPASPPSYTPPSPAAPGLTMPAATTPAMPVYTPRSSPVSPPTVPSTPVSPAVPVSPPATAYGSFAGSSTLLNPAATPVPPVVPPTAAVSTIGTSASTGMALPAVDPQPAPIGLGGSFGATTPVPVWTGPQTPPPPAPEPPHIAVINYLAFDLAYEVETHGPSGIERVVLWVTRDDGHTWVKWSQHDGKNSSLRVNLNVPANPQVEGPYGFRVVPISGAGLSEKEPAPGDAPDLRVIVDVTPPALDIFPPVGDAGNPDTLVIRWRAADRNFADDPMTIEWAEKPTGPWQPVAVGGEVVQTVAGSAPILRRLPNVGGLAPATGQYAWRVPPGLPPRVYLKVCARDAAGNVREVITRDPILVDLVKPRAKINGIVPPPALTIAPPK